MARTFISSILLALAASPAHAQGGTAIPEPSNLALFGIGIAGLVVGRQVAKRRAKNDD